MSRGGDIVTPVVVGDDSRQCESDTDCRDDEEDLKQVRGGVADVDALVDRQRVERRDRAIEGHAGDHDDDGGNGERHSRQGGPGDEELSQQSNRYRRQSDRELPRHMEDVNEQKPPGISQRTDHGGECAGLGAGIEQHGEAVGRNE